MNNNQKITNLYPKMFLWVVIGLLITFCSGYAISLNDELMTPLVNFGFIPIIIVELVIAFIFGLRINKMHLLTAKILYIVFSIITGITFSTIFVKFEISYLINIFIITAIIFAILSLIGYTTKKDLTKFGNIIFISLIVIVIVSFLNIFVLKNSIVDTSLLILGILIFMGFVIYDVNSIKETVNEVGIEKASVFGAFQLFLDFINIFIHLVQLIAKHDD